MLISAPSVQSPRAYDNQNLTSALLGARFAAGANAALRTNLRTAQQDTGWWFTIHPRETAEGLVAANLRFGFEYGDIRRYGALGDGTTNDKAAFQLAIDCADSVYIHQPETYYKMTSGVIVDRNRVWLLGDGAYVSPLQFEPTANGVCITCANGATTINQGGIWGISIRSADSTYVKTAIRIDDCSGYTVENVIIGGSVVHGSAGFWSDAASDSIGIQIRGRDTSHFNRITAFCDRPILISPNANAPGTIDLDHTNFSNFFLGANDNPCVEVEAGCVLTQVSFTGFHAWVLGTQAFRWVDGATPGASNGLVFENVRYENSQTPAAKAFHIDLTGSKLATLYFSGGQAGVCAGFHFRGINTVTLDQFFYSDTSREAMNANSTVDCIIFRGCTWNTGSTATMTGLSIVEQQSNVVSGPLPQNGMMMPTAFLLQTSNVADMGGQVTIASAALQPIGTTSLLGILVILDETAQTVGEFELRGTNNATSELHDPAGFFSAVAGTATSLNVYWNAGTSRYVIQNTHAGSRTVRYKLIARH